jgi:uncharacterized protein (TIGR03435 family)
MLCTLAVLALGVLNAFGQSNTSLKPLPETSSEHSTLDSVSPHRDDVTGSYAPRFDVVSIRPSGPDSSTFGVGGSTFGGEYRAIYVPLGITIVNAYLPRLALSSSKDRLLGAPAWVWNVRYDFVGRVAPEDLPEWERMNEHWSILKPMKMEHSMLQAALEDRCKLVAHRIHVEGSGYALVVGKHGLNWKKVKASKADEAVPPEASHGIAPGGRVVPFMRGAEPITRYYRTSMASFSEDLSGRLGSRVEDRTGVAGQFDFALTQWQNDDGSHSYDIEDLGLKLQPIKVSIEKMVIDHIERPSPN